MKTLYLSVAFCIIATACNDEIFVDRSDLPEITDIVIEGDGGQWSSVFSRKGLERISIDYAANDKEYVRYYGTGGGEVGPDCPPSELESIVYENPRTSYSVGFGKEMIEISSSYNASPYETFTVRLEYDYGTVKYMNVTITEGKELELFSWESAGELELSENVMTSTHSMGLVNNSHLTQKLEVFPYLYFLKCSDVAIPADRWAQGMEVDIPMLAFDGKIWEWHEYDDIRLGERRDFSPSRYCDEKIVVEVPAYTSAKVHCRLNYTRATQDGFLSFFNSVSEQVYKVPVNWISTYATSYEYAVEYE